MAMAKKKLNVEEIIELLKASYDGMPNFTPILNKGTIDTLYEINEKTVHSPEISTGYYGFCKKSEIVSELNRLFCELLLDIRANGDLHQHRRTEITRENGIERTRSYYNDVVKAWLYQFSRTNHPVEYKDKIIEINLQPETSAYTPEITPTVEQPSHFFPVNVNPSKPKNAHEVAILMESHGTTSAPETEQPEASASTPEAFKINPDLAPDFDAAFDECAYSPDYQTNRAIFDDEPQSRSLTIRRRPATTGRRLPTPKNPHGFVCNFSECTDPEKLHKMLNTGNIDVVKAIAESFNEFQPRTDGKPMTKKDYVTAIVRLYFPDYQPKKPAQEVKRDCMGREIIQCGSKFIPGKFYVAGLANYRNEPNPEPEFIKVIKRKNDTITVQVVSYPDFQPVFKPVSKKAKQFHYYYKGKTLALYESITLPNSHDYEGKAMRIASLCEYNAMFITAPGYDVDFDETAYTPERQDNLAVLDDIPADHEPDVQKVKITPVQEAKPDTTEQPREPWLEHTCNHCNGTPNWTHEQFIRGILLSYEHKESNSKVSEYLPMSRYLTQKYSLAQLHNLAKFFGLNVPTIELTSEHKTAQKSQQIAYIIADEISSMEHVYTCTYNTAGAPDLPAELTEHAPEWEKETIARAQAMPVTAPAEPEHQQKKHCPLIPLSYWDRHTKSHNEECRKNRKFIDTLQTVEEITAIMLDFGMKNIFEQAIYDRVHLSGQYPRETDEETTARYAETYAQKIITRRQRKAKAEARKNAPKPATRKPRHAKKLDTSRQILIQFDEPENTPVPFLPAKPKTRRTRKPRVKRDYSRQILIDFGEDIPDSQNNKRIAA